MSITTSNWESHSLNTWLENDIKHHASSPPYHTVHSPSSTFPSPVLSLKEFKKSSIDAITKRQRNTDSARKSRLRKAIKMETLEKNVDRLKQKNDRLRVQVAVLETEVSHVADKEERNRQRVLELEAQLAHAHRQLVQ